MRYQRMFDRAISASIVFATACASAGEKFKHADVFLADDNGVLMTGAIIDDITLLGDVHVFAGEFGESGVPGFTSDPGFNSFACMFDPATRIGFNALDGVMKWNGEAFVPADEATMTVSFLTLSVVVSDSPTPGFDLAVQSDGDFHRHLNYQIQSGDGSDAEPGVYALELEMYSTDSDVVPSQPFWKIFNHEMSEDIHDAAVEWAIVNFAGASLCEADLNDDGSIGPGDLAIVLGQWGEDAGSIADLNDDAVVGPADLAIVLGSWGLCATDGASVNPDSFGCYDDP